MSVLDTFILKYIDKTYQIFTYYRGLHTGVQSDFNYSAFVTPAATIPPTPGGILFNRCLK